MTTTLTWSEISVRLALTFFAGILIGIDRGEHARPAGLRTTLLVCLAASISMIQANILLNSTGKPSDSFAIMDIMRLPLGILSGMGFIGAGAILRKDKMIIGVTTAATLWFVTVMGLCFGGGQYGLGIVSLCLALIVLSGLKLVEENWKQDRQGTLVIAVSQDGPDDQDISTRLQAAHFKIVSWSVNIIRTPHEREYRCSLEWRECPKEVRPPALLKELTAIAGVQRINWETQ